MNKLCENCRLKETCGWDEWNTNRNYKYKFISCTDYTPNLKINKELNEKDK